MACGLSCPSACGILVPRPGIEPMSPALEGGFLTTAPPGKPFIQILKSTFHLQLLQNIGYIPRVVRYISEPLLQPIVRTSHSLTPILPLPPHLMVFNSQSSVRFKYIYSTWNSVWQGRGSVNLSSMPPRINSEVAACTPRQGERTAPGCARGGPRPSDGESGSGSPEPTSISPGLLLEVLGKRSSLWVGAAEEVNLERLEGGFITTWGGLSEQEASTGEGRARRERGGS